MSPWLTPLCVLCSLCVAACQRQQPPLVAQVSGEIHAAVSAPVRIVRDRYGIPHIYARSQDDLFFAQGFVQAQDRLFQMDLWRRSAQGRLSEILGPNFVERDGMTRRMQYVGDLDAEWASYGADARAIASAFVRGVNAWVAVAQERLPEEFRVAGWRPEPWSPLDLLNRTDAFVESGDGVDEVARRGLSPVVAEAIRRVGTKPFLAGAKRIEGARDVPSPRYLVHLNAPGWNVIGETAPWRPGVAVGHNDRVSWHVEPAAVDTQDIYIEPASTPVRAIKDAIRIRGRSELFEFAREFTAHGIVVASDRERGTVYTLQWSGFEPGSAAELGALAIDGAQSDADFRSRLVHWKMPPRRFVTDRLIPNPQSLIPTPVTFTHVLAITDALRQRFNIGPIAPGSAPPAPSVPGQSESPSSPHFSDLAKLWERGEAVPLAFTDADVEKQAEAMLVLTPKK